jgi:glycosyltransferase involved in cell wall biosynthesis
MASSCPIVASSTQPVQEVLTDGISALLVDFFDVPSQVEAVDKLLGDPDLAERLGIAASERADEYSVSRGFKAWDKLISQ